MREIKFRQWSEQNKKFFYWGYVDRGFSSPTTVNGVAVPTPSEQFTGLLDKNGVEIYEGDIVRLDDGEEYFDYTVEWREAGFWLTDGVANVSRINSDDMWLCENIGNIYENKDLLK